MFNLHVPGGNSIHTGLGKGAGGGERLFILFIETTVGGSVAGLVPNSWSEGRFPLGRLARGWEGDEAVCHVH